MSRPNWCDYFMQIAYDVAARSPDPSTQHGCVLVGDDMSILSTGYNGPPSGVDRYPTERPAKYDYFLHAEQNALLYCKGRPVAAYITGPPCATCAKMLLQAGVRLIVFGDRIAKCLTDEGMDAVRDMAEQVGCVMVQHG